MRWIALTFLLLTAGCTTFSAPNPVSSTTIYELRAGYDAAVLAPAANYRRLYDDNPCPEGVHATVANVCGEREIVVKLQQADLAASAALDAAEDFVRQHPTLDAAAVIAVAQAAIAAATQIAAINGVD